MAMVEKCMESVFDSLRKRATGHHANIDEQPILTHDWI